MPLFLSYSVRSWLEHLPPGLIRTLVDLKDVFAGNFEGTYARLGNPWDLRCSRQEPSETLTAYI